MTVPANLNRVDYTGTGSAGPFTVPFPFYDASHLTVLQTDALFNQTTLTGWTATGAGGPSGAVTLAAACPVGSTLTILRIVPLTQITSIKNQEAFYPEVHEQEMDLLAMADQQLDEAMDRTLRLPAGLSGVDMTLPRPDPGHALVWNAAGDGLENAGVASATLQQDLSDSADVAKGDEMIAVKQPFAGAVARTQHDKNAEWITPQDFGAVGNGTFDDSDAFIAMFATGKFWYIPFTENGYLISKPLTISESGLCRGKLVAKAGFAGTFVRINATRFDRKLIIDGLHVHSTDTTPDPYSASRTTGIFVGPSGEQICVNSIMNCTLNNCAAARFSIGVFLSGFNIYVNALESVMNHTNLAIYSFDTSLSQVNDIIVRDSSLGSGTFGVRLGTNPTTPSFDLDGSQGVNVVFEGCNFDASTSTLDNILGLFFRNCYFEFPADGQIAPIYISQAGANSITNCKLTECFFNNQVTCVKVFNRTPNIEVSYCEFASVSDSVVILEKAETQLFKFSNNYFGGSSNFSTKPSVLTNYSSGIATTQLTFTNLSIDNVNLVRGIQTLQTEAMTEWYPYGKALNGWVNQSSSNGRYVTSGRLATSCAGTQSGQVITFTNPSHALLFNGGDKITSTAGGAVAVFSTNHTDGTITVDSSFSGAVEISHAPVTLLFDGVRYGSPEGSFTAPVGSRYTDVSNGRLWIKTTGTGNTGWSIVSIT